MSRLTAIQPQAATGKAKELLDAVQAKLKITPNMTKVMANSPAVLEAYLSFSGALGNGALDAKLREEIALEVGEQNSSQYCVSAHTAIGKMTGLSDSEIQQARDARSGSPRNAAALQFARELVAKKGRATDADVEAVRRAGFSDGDIVAALMRISDDDNVCTVANTEVSPFNGNEVEREEQRDGTGSSGVQGRQRGLLASRTATLACGAFGSQDDSDELGRG